MKNISFIKKSICFFSLPKIFWKVQNLKINTNGRKLHKSKIARISSAKAVLPKYLMTRKLYKNFAPTINSNHISVNYYSKYHSINGHVFNKHGKKIMVNLTH